MSSPSVWVQLCYEGYKPKGQSVEIEPLPRNIGALVKQVVKGELKKELDHAGLTEIFVCLKTKQPYSQENALDPGENIPLDTTSTNPLIVVAPAPQQQLEYAVAGPIATVGPPAARGPPSTPRSRDISNQIAAVFEGEVNAHLEINFHNVLPECSFSKFRTREIDDGDGDGAFEFDTFSYMTHDTLEPAQSNSASGIYVVQSNHIIKKNPEKAPNVLSGSPGARASGIERAEKYVVGESYSGDRDDTIKKKVHQLEKNLGKMKLRHSKQFSAVSDATSLFGAAILSFTCQSLPRKDQANKCMALVLKELSSSQTPILFRLAQAERFLIVVLSIREGPSTCALREIAHSMQNVEMGIQAILETLYENAGEGNRKIVAEHQY